MFLISLFRLLVSIHWRPALTVNGSIWEFCHFRRVRFLQSHISIVHDGHFFPVSLQPSVSSKSFKNIQRLGGISKGDREKMTEIPFTSLVPVVSPDQVRIEECVLLKCCNNILSYSAYYLLKIKE